MIINEVQRRATKAHLEQFEAAATNLEGEAGSHERSKLAQLEIDAVRAQADDPRAEIEEYERLWSGQVSSFEAASHQRHVRRLVAERRIPFLKWGHLLRFDPMEIQAWIDGFRQHPGRPRIGV